MIKMWNSDSFECFKSLNHKERVLSVAISNDGNTVISGSYSCSMKIWDTCSGICIHTITVEDTIVSVFLSNDKNFALLSMNQYVEIIDTSSGYCIKKLNHSDEEVRSVVMSNDGNIILSGSERGSIKIWEFSTGRCIKTLRGHNDQYGNKQVGALAISNDGNTIISGSKDHTIKIWK
jgi:WD40 repeat protein